MTATQFIAEEVHPTSLSQAVKAQMGLRAMILAGELAGGTRIAELSLVDKLAVSRTPIRAALVRLEQEGLLVALPGGGFLRRMPDLGAPIVDLMIPRADLESVARRLLDAGAGTAGTWTYEALRVGA